jgi:hypothetical protein
MAIRTTPDQIDGSSRDPVMPILISYFSMAILVVALFCVACSGRHK